MRYPSTPLIPSPTPGQMPDLTTTQSLSHRRDTLLAMYATYIFPRLMDWVLRGARFQTERRRLLAAAHGMVVEIGFGTGLNLPHYPPTVTALFAVDPAPLLPHRVAQRVASAAFPVHLQHVTAEELPYGNATFDCAVSTFTLCTIPDPLRSLREVRRVLKPNGRFLFLEHGRSDDPATARWQDRLNPLQRRLACGCNLNRRIDRLVIEAGLQIEQLDRDLLAGVPRIGGELYRGIART